MDKDEFLAAQFEAERPHLRAVAFRMLGSLSEADDAVQESWLRLSRSGAAGLETVATGGAAAAPRTHVLGDGRERSRARSHPRRLSGTRTARRPRNAHS